MGVARRLRPDNSSPVAIVIETRRTPARAQAKVVRCPVCGVKLASHIVKRSLHSHPTLSGAERRRHYESVLLFVLNANRDTERPQTY